MSKHPPIHVNDRTSIVEIDGLTYIVDPAATSHETTEWLHKHYRTQAFGAIRRAAEVARELDRVADAHMRYAPRPFRFHGAEYRHKADCVRRAIRAAIGIPKT